MAGAADYYRSELGYLRDLGREFAAAHPDAARYLAAESADPDVERLLEGVAFLTGRLRQKLDDELPDLADALIDGVWPHYLRPTPAMAIVQFAPSAHARGTTTVPRGTMVDSVPVDGTRCRFTTAYEARVSPLRVTEVAWSGAAMLRIRFDAPEGVSAGICAGNRLRLHLSGDSAVARQLLECLCRSRTVEAAAVGVDGIRATRLPPAAIQAVGFDDDDALLPEQELVPASMRLIHEHFVFPDKFLFVDIVGLDAVTALEKASGFTLSFALDGVPDPLPVVSASDIALGCTPVVNLFHAEGDPIRLDPRHADHRVRAAGRDPAHAEIYALRSVVGAARSGSKPQRYLACRSPGPMEHPGTYQERRSRSIGGDGTDVTLCFTHPGEADVETISLELICTNRRLPERLGIGDIRQPAPGTPAGVSFRNLGRLRPPCPPPDDRDEHWRLLAHLSLSRDPLGDADGLKRLLDLLDVRSESDPLERLRHRRLRDGIVSLTRDPATRILDGVPIRGVSIDLEIREDRFDSPGDLYAFAAVMDRAVCRGSGLNSFSRLRVTGTHGRGLLEFPARLGGIVLP